MCFNEAFQSKLLELFENTISFLNHHSIRWFVYGGTCLGTIRHKGFIPWDDDIDIAVLRDDYDRLLSLSNSAKEHNLSIISIENDSAYYQGFAKICDPNTTLWERKEYRKIIGVYIDIFPLDKSDIDAESAYKIMCNYRHCFKRYRKCLNETTIVDMFKYLLHCHIKTFITILGCSFLRHKRRKLYELFCCSVKSIPYNPNGEFLISITGSYGIKEHYDAKWFSDSLDMSFESLIVKMPIGYDNYLTQVYGDYMTPPPIEKQVSHHDHYYCNLREGLSIKEVELRISQGEYIVF